MESDTRNNLLIIGGLVVLIGTMTYLARPEESEGLAGLIGSAMATDEAAQHYDNRAIQYLPQREPDNINLSRIQLLSQPRRYDNVVCYDGQYNRVSCLDES